MSRIDESKDFIPVRIAVLAVSDTRSLAEDKSGDVLEGRIYKSLPLGTAEWAAVQVVWDDGEKSAVQKVRPCPNVGESTCGLVE